jgi:hypothetical protein
MPENSEGTLCDCLTFSEQLRQVLCLIIIVEKQRVIYNPRLFIRLCSNWTMKRKKNNCSNNYSPERSTVFWNDVLFFERFWNDVLNRLCYIKVFCQDVTWMINLKVIWSLLLLSSSIIQVFMVVYYDLSHAICGSSDSREPSVHCF